MTTQAQKKSIRRALLAWVFLGIPASALANIAAQAADFSTAGRLAASGVGTMLVMLATIRWWGVDDDL